MELSTGLTDRTYEVHRAEVNYNAIRRKQCLTLHWLMWKRWLMMKKTLYSLTVV